MSDIRTMGKGPLLACLDHALARVSKPEKLVGREIPRIAREWAEEQELEVIESKVAPVGQLYVLGAIPESWEAE